MIKSLCLTLVLAFAVMGQAIAKDPEPPVTIVTRVLGWSPFPRDAPLPRLQVAFEDNPALAKITETYLAAQGFSIAGPDGAHDYKVGYASTLTEALARKDRSFVATENANHRTDHAVVGAIVARTWRLPLAVAQATRLHHDFSCLDDARIDPTVRHLVAMALVADHLLHQHEEPSALKEWERHGQQCLAHLQVGEAEVDHWVDQLHPVFEAHALGL